MQAVTQYVPQELVAQALPYLAPFKEMNTLNSGLAGGAAGHLLTLALGKEAAFAAALALTVLGANHLETPPAQAALLAFAIHIGPTVVQQVVAKVATKVIWGALNTVAIGTVGVGKWSFHLLTGFYFYQPAEQELQNTIAELRAEIAKLQAKNTELKLKVASLKQQIPPPKPDQSITI